MIETQKPKRGMAWKVLNTFALPQKLDSLYEAVHAAYKQSKGEATTEYANAKLEFIAATEEAVMRSAGVDARTHKCVVVYRPARVDFGITPIKAPKTPKKSSAFVVLDPEEATPLRRRA